MNEVPRIRPKERDAILLSLRAGVVPRAGQHHIQVGRAAEVKALVGDLARVADGGATVRFVIGDYGSGKTFFMHLVRAIALEKRLVTLHADLGPERRLHGGGGQARSLYNELLRNAATRSKPEGGAIASVVERFITSALEEARTQGVSPDVVIRSRLQSLSELVGGYDFAEVISAYWKGHDTGNETLKSDAVRWLRGEFSTRTDARAALGVRTIVDDSNWYDLLKLLARFVKQAGYAGLLVGLDEMVNLYKLASGKARSTNYEQILRILNDCLQGSAASFGVLFGGTPEFLMDTRRGLYSYQALQSRLAENAFARDGLVDLTGPVIRLASLTPEDFYVLLRKLRHVYAAGDESQHLLPDEGLHAFMAHCSKRIGDDYFRTPRTTITAFVNLLAVLDQNRGVPWSDLISGVEVIRDASPEAAPASGQSVADDGPAAGDGQASAPADDELASFRL